MRPPLEICRRILIPESLCDFVDDAESDLEEAILLKLRSVRTSYRKSLEAGKVYKFGDDRIKEWRQILSASTIDGSGWILFCQTYLLKQITAAWDDVVKQCRLNFISLRDGEGHSLITGQVAWAGVTEIMGNFGLSSADAMISNLLINSKLKFLVTSDGDLKSIADFLENHGKEIISLT